MTVKLVEEIRKQPSKTKWDKRVAGFSEITTVLQEVLFFIIISPSSSFHHHHLITHYLTIISKHLTAPTNHQILDYTYRDYIHSWYHHISEDQQFRLEIRRSIQQVFVAFSNRLAFPLPFYAFYHHSMFPATDPITTISCFFHFIHTTQQRIEAYHTNHTTPHQPHHATPTTPRHTEPPRLTWFPT